MTNKNKEILLKVVIILGAIFCVLFVIIGFISDYYQPGHPNHEIFYVLKVMTFIVFLFFGLILFIMMCFVKISPETIHTKPIKYNILAGDYKEFKQDIEKVLSNNGFEKYYNIIQEENEIMDYYVNSNNKNYQFLLIKVNEIDKNFEERVLYKFDEYLSEQNISYYGNEYLIYCICVDRVNTDFTKLIGQDVQQSYGKYRLPVGISFGGKTLYISSQKSGLFKTKYNKLRKLVIDIFQMIISEKIII